MSSHESRARRDPSCAIVYNGHWGHYEQWGLRKLFELERNYYFLQGIEKILSEKFPFGTEDLKCYMLFKRNEALQGLLRKDEGCLKKKKKANQTVKYFSI